MARLSYDSDSEDELPDLNVMVRRMAEKKSGAKSDKENAPTREPKIKTEEGAKSSKYGSLSKGATPLRRRKLGNSQALDGSLFQKWSASDVECLKQEGQEGGAPARSRSTRVRSREVREKSAEISRGSSEEPMRNGVDLPESEQLRPKSKLDVTAKSTRMRVEQRQRTRKILVSDDDESEDDVKQEVEEYLEVFAIVDGKEESSGSEASEFVTALSLDTESDSSLFEPESPPVLRRSKNPRGQRLKAPKLPVTTDPSKKPIPASKPTVKRSQRAGSSEQQPLEPPKTPPKRVESSKSSEKEAPGSIDLENAFKKLRIFAEELDDSPNDKAQRKPEMDPVTPKKTLLASPTKAPRIPMSPWKPEHNEFWDAKIQNEWIDRHSPPKRSSPKKKLGLGLGQGGGTETDEKAALKKKYSTSPEKKEAKKAFDQVKESIAKNFLGELDDRITGGKLAKLTASTGGVRIQWSTTLQSTAGRAHWKCKERVTMSQQPDGSLKSTKERQHDAFIELATRVLGNEDDLLNTVAHEFCHLVTFMLDGKPKFAHGAEFKAWGQKCMNVFGRSHGIVVTTKHNYEIDYKYIWRCVDCTTEVHRHSKSVDPVKQRCGRCRGILQQVKPVPRGGGGANGTKTKTAYQEFVGSEMKVLKASGKAMSFKEMMSVVSTRWKAQQQKVAAAGGKSVVSENEVQELKDKYEKLSVSEESW